MRESNKLKECQKELLLNSRYVLNLSMPQQCCYDYENAPKQIKWCCKYTGKIMYAQIPDQMYIDDLTDISKNALNYMHNEICKDCEYCDFF